MNDLKRAKALWNLLDDIDTVPDAIHPNDERSHELCWRKMIAIADKRHEILESDGYTLRYPGELR